MKYYIRNPNYSVTQENFIKELQDNGVESMRIVDDHMILSIETPKKDEELEEFIRFHLIPTSTEVKFIQNPCMLDVGIEYIQGDNIELYKNLNPECECGAVKVNSNRHSYWCGAHVE